VGCGEVEGNPRLRTAVLKRWPSFAKINRSGNKKGTGELEGVNYTEITFEGTALWSCYFVDALTTTRTEQQQM
jgi:transcriptional/translational regulatory protein YebC/TACO1